eukprot:TRINITY_DN5189_c0_g1_i1.p1 TRINITY_DN5189_c0_g1~~TRINITY_DN5189_c0_g1_i1.p1  ORF type:complete len:455 (+),score=46.64 TRINITY_DN5189_c0_g1_i1:134-1366(+)
MKMRPRRELNGYLEAPEQTVRKSSRKDSNSRAQEMYKSVLSKELEYSKAQQHCASIPLASPFSLSPLSPKVINILKAKNNSPRPISSTPSRILEAPHIKDDYYLNLLDWSSQNILAVALGNAVFLWNGHTTKVTHLMGASETVTGIAWTPNGNYLAVGTHKGTIQLWDATKKTLMHTYEGHTSRVGALSWHGNNFFSSGSRDHNIVNRDLRMSSTIVSKWSYHRQEVCGLKWSEGEQCASGGNDNKLLIWDIRKSDGMPLWKFSRHKAAVKAIAWSPHKRGIISSGGGTADRCIRFWNTNRGIPLQCIDTGSQVCNLAWSKNVNELVSTHGYSQHQIVVWSYPHMKSLATLTGHTSRVLYLSVSPDGRTVVTGAGDETIRFWSVFPEAKPSSHSHGARFSPRHGQIKTIR